MVDVDVVVDGAVDVVGCINCCRLSTHGTGFRNVKFMTRPLPIIMGSLNR